MTELVVNPHATAQWHALVKEAEKHNGVQFDEEIESYLVFMLMRYTERPELAAKVMALDYLESLLSHGNEKRQRMRDVGDQCLLFSGLFPRRAERRRVSIAYYVNLGRSAYQSVADVAQNTMATMFSQLANSFVELMDVLQAMRSMHDAANESLDPIQAYELWRDTGSQRARQVLNRSSESTPIISRNNSKH